MYREQRNAMWNVIMHRGRSRSIDELFPKDSVRAMIKALNQNYFALLKTKLSWSGYNQ